MCPVPFKLSTCVRRSWVLAGGRYQIRLLSRTATNGPVANSGGSGTRKKEESRGALFYNGRHVTPRGCCCSVKQDHQFLNKISTDKLVKYYFSPSHSLCEYIQAATKLFVHQLILNIFINFSESNAHTMPSFFYMLMITHTHERNIKFNFQNKGLNLTNLTDKLCKIGNDKIIRTLENIVLD